jgi:osmotically-inducible protein OsmY
MKIKNVVSGTFLAGLMAVGVHAQPAGQPGRGSPPAGELPPGLERRDELPPGLQGRELPPGLNRRTNQAGVLPPTGRTNQFGTQTNQFGTQTNQFGSQTNQFGRQPDQQRQQDQQDQQAQQDQQRQQTEDQQQDQQRDQDLTPTGRAETTVKEDQAFTQQDKTVLMQVRQTVQTQIRTITAETPIYFVVREGVVRLVGTVPNQQEIQRIETVVQRIPGVVRVVNELHVEGQQPQTRVMIRDQAFTPQDRTVLTQVRQGVQTQIRTITTATPVYFVVREGVVRLVGSVPSQQEAQQIEMIVQQTPGVVRVINELRVEVQPGAQPGTGAATTDTQTAPQTQQNQTNQVGTTTRTNDLAPTSRTNGMQRTYPGQTNQVNGTQLPPTGRTNGPPSGLPPGLQRRDELPPGLQKRDELPPGLQRRTNDAAAPNNG